MTSNNTPGPPAQEYGADEISALVLDPGYSLTRAGFAGEDTPKSVVPTIYGTRADDAKKLVFDDNSIHNPLSYLDIKNPLSSEGIVEDWDVATKLWEYAITSRLTGPRQRSALRNGLNDPQDGDAEGDVNMEDATEELEKPLAESPLLMTEPGWNPLKNREKSIEIAMEDWGAPAFYLARAGVLAAFASGKPSALVIDLGASNTSCTPVYDGLMLRKGTVKSPLAGDFVSNQIRLLLSQQTPPVPINPHYLVASKTAVDAGAPPQFTRRVFNKQPFDSFHRLQEDRVLHEFKEGCVQVWNPARHLGHPLSTAAEMIKGSEPGRPWELPDGWNNVWGVDRYRVAEGLFDEKAALTDASSPAPQQSQTLRALMRQSLHAIDVDTRQQILSNVIVTGGTSLIQGMTDRISFELTTEFAGARVRINAPGNYAERTFASWIGGSILASLGNFHQMWISKKEYDEAGPNIVEKRCK